MLTMKSDLSHEGGEGVVEAKWEVEAMGENFMALGGFIE